jgi:hypothetical protein
MRAAASLRFKSSWHERLDSTMIYARVHDKTVAEDYYRAMDEHRKRINLE